MKRLVLASAFLGQMALADDVALIRKQFIEYYAQQSVSDTAVKRYMETQRPDGTWPNIDYTSKQRGGWETGKHLQCLEQMAAAYAVPESSGYQNEQLKDAILRGIGHWIEKDYRNPNWWHGRIGIPKTMLSIFILLGDDLPEQMKEDAQPILKRSKMGMTGQNKVWCAGIALMKGLLADDADIMRSASEAIWSELQVTTNEGIQPDWSFHQHGPQQQFGNYGLSFGGDMVMWGSVLRGTPYALRGEKQVILRNYLLEGPSWILWNDRLDLSGCGRQVDAGCQAAKARGIMRQLERMIQIDPDYRTRYEECLSRVGHKSFWRSDMAVHRRSDWYASVKMSSTRVIGSETCNSENMLGLHLGDGALMVHLAGSEYENIQPLWDWNRLPGTTCDQGLENLTPIGSSGGYGGSDFSGVLGNGATGMAAMIYKRDELEARKAWFFEKDAVICLGAGIDGKTKGPVYTSIQQSWMEGSVMNANGKLTNGTHTLKAGEWVHHAGIGYQLMDETACTIKKVEGNWHPIFPTRGDRPASGDVFSLWMDHGASPKKQTYAYTIYPQTDASQMKAFVDMHQTKILSNTETLQAIEGTNGFQAVFYKRGKLRLGSGKVLAVDAPCLLSWQDSQLTVSDPTHTRSTLKVSIGLKEKVVKLPSGANSGQQVVIK